MVVIVTEAGFAPEHWTVGFVTLDALASGEAVADGAGVDFPNDRDPAELAPWLDRVALIRVGFPSAADGRGFSIATQLRTMGYAGRLRAAGPLIADQFRAARRVGFDEIELPDAMAARQPEAQWRLRPQGSYRDRLGSS
jgi:uncharacterized protein (DUF934 family)